MGPDFWVDWFDNGAAVRPKMGPGEFGLQNYRFSWCYVAFLWSEVITPFPDMHFRVSFLATNSRLWRKRGPSLLSFRCAVFLSVLFGNPSPHSSVKTVFSLGEVPKNHTFWLRSGFAQKKFFANFRLGQKTGCFQWRLLPGPKICAWGCRTNPRNIFCLWPTNRILSPPSRLTLFNAGPQGCDITVSNLYFCSVLLPTRFLGRCLLRLFFLFLSFVFSLFIFSSFWSAVFRPLVFFSLYVGCGLGFILCCSMFGVSALSPSMPHLPFFLARQGLLRQISGFLRFWLRYFPLVLRRRTNSHSRGGRRPRKGPKKLPEMTHSNTFSANIFQFFRSGWAWLFKMLPCMEEGRSNQPLRCCCMNLQWSRSSIKFGLLSTFVCIPAINSSLPSQEVANVFADSYAACILACLVQVVG